MSTMCVATALCGKCESSSHLAKSRPRNVLRCVPRIQAVQLKPCNVRGWFCSLQLLTSAALVSFYPSDRRLIRMRCISIR